MSLSANAISPLAEAQAGSNSFAVIEATKSGGDAICIATDTPARLPVERADATLAAAITEQCDISALVKGLLDRVIIPALVREWIAQNAKAEAN